MTIDSVACFWEWQADCWHLMRVAANPGRDELDLWTWRLQNDVDYAAVPGRAVTQWTWTQGVCLYDWHPVGDVSGFSLYAGQSLRKWRNWTEVVEGGTSLWAGTWRAAQKLVEQASRPWERAE